ncbi:MAG TPA: ABC transporter ATP-binding protein, partial [Leptospiraceae bacterium]|nr:ABC transporter ATP-binding protein [Leptospiraceae bacterium]
MSNAVEVSSLIKRYGDFYAVNNISFTVEKGEIFGFLGANGAGKSTTIKILCGITSPSSGKASVAGFDAAEQSARIKEKIGYMSQKFTLYDDLTVEENIRFFAGIRNIAGETLNTKMKEVLELSELEGRGKLITKDLPGGWKQKLALGCSILHGPEILFLDEPTAGVDPQARRVFWEIIFSLQKKGTTVFITSHYMDEVEQCSRIALMHRGSIAALKSPEDLKKDIIPGTILNLQCRNPLAASPQLQKIPEIRRIDPLGRG